MTRIQNQDLIRKLEKKGVAHLILNRPKALNALNYQMGVEMLHFLERYEKDEQCLFFLIEGTGDRAFCAGGDLRQLYHYLRSPYQEVKALSVKFFEHEYALDFKIANLKKPYIALLDGYVMGGGAGISLHGSYPIATSHTLFAMPENRIGLFPDVGSVFFLRKTPSSMGLFLALTGHRLSGEELFKAGLAKYYCPSEHLPHLKEKLLTLETTHALGPLLDSFHDFKEDAVDHERFHFMAHIFDNLSSLEEAFERLKASKSPYAMEALKSLEGASKLSLEFTFQHFKTSANWDLKQCLKADFAYASYLTKHGDFQSYVKAVIFDKKTPKGLNAPIDFKGLSKQVSEIRSGLNLNLLQL